MSANDQSRAASYWQTNSNIGASVPRLHSHLLEENAASAGTSKSAVIRRAIAAFLRWPDYELLIAENAAQKEHIRELKTRLCEVRSAPCGLCGGSGVGLRELPDFFNQTHNPSGSAPSEG